MKIFNLFPLYRRKDRNDRVSGHYTVGIIVIVWGFSV